MSKVLLLASAQSYRTGAYQRAARTNDIELLVAAPALAGSIDLPGRGIRYERDAPDIGAICRAALATGPVDGVTAADDDVVSLASEVAARLGVIHNPTSATVLTRRKDLARRCQLANQIDSPLARVIKLDQPLAPQLTDVAYPCVIKPLALSASRGVIRANDESALLSAAKRVHKLLYQETQGDERHLALVEDYLAGREIAVEGFIQHGHFSSLVVFDKPDPLTGPFFEETYYVTPPRNLDLEAVNALIQKTVRAYGLVTGPVHVECRINDRGVWLLELAARTIGGDCAQMFEFVTGASLEELVLTQAAGGELPINAPQGACGVLMIPVPGNGGILRRVEGMSAARAVPFVERVQIDVRQGAELIAWPEGGVYPGFVFARGPTSDIVETALRHAHECLTFILAPRLSVQIR